MLSGCEHPDIIALAKRGNFGEFQGNSHRDMISLHFRKMQITQRHVVKVPMKDTKTQRETQEEVALLLPHMMFSNLSLNYPDVFQDFFCVSQCLAFWKSVTATKDPRLTLTKGKVASPGKTVPLFIHGDGCEFATRDPLMTWSWGSLLSKNPSLSSHLLLAAVPKSFSLPTTWRPLDDWISWSFAALTEGVHPEVGPYGKPLTKGYTRADGSIGWAALDKRVAQSCDLEHPRRCRVSSQFAGRTSSHVMNHECSCQKPIYKKEPCPPGRSVKIIKVEDQDFQDTTIEAVLDKRTITPYLMCLVCQPFMWGGILFTSCTAGGWHHTLQAACCITSASDKKNHPPTDLELCLPE